MVRFAIRILILTAIICPLIMGKPISFIMYLEQNDNKLQCLRRDTGDFTGLCIVLSVDGQPLSEQQPFQCYLDDQPVYQRSQDQGSEALGVLRDNTAPAGTSAHDSCPGIPLSNFGEQLKGRYTCNLSGFTGQRADLAVQYCAGGGKDQATNEGRVEQDHTSAPKTDTFTLLLKKGEKEVSCVQEGVVEHDDYCLQVAAETGKPLNYPFSCYLNQSTVYQCRGPDQCQAEGVLRELHGLVPPTVKSCHGLNFANLVPSLYGRYTCTANNHTAVHSILPCPAVVSENNTVINKTEESTPEPRPTVKYIAFGVVVGVVGVVVVLYKTIKWRGRCKSQTALEESVELKEKPEEEQEEEGTEEQKKIMPKDTENLKK